MEHRVHYAKSGALNIAYQVVGAGPVDLVFVQGWVTHLDLAWDIPAYARFLERLGSFSRLIIIDKRGTGLSDRVASADLPTLEQRMDDVRAVMDAVRSERAVVFGTLPAGGIAGLFAATHPERTLGLIVYGSIAKTSTETGLLVRLADTVEAALDRIENEWGTEGVGVAFWAPSLVTDDKSKRAYMRLLRAGASPGAARAMMALGYQVDWRAILPAVKVPTLVLHRTGDLVCSVSEGRKIAEGIAGAKFVELPGNDHLIWAGDSESVLREVESFLHEIGPARKPDRVLATILITDVVGSTELASRLGDREWRDVLERHHEDVRQRIAESHGRVIDTAGDGFLATFDGPARAIACARAIGSSTESLGFQVRAGLHTGEVELVDGNLRGIAVHIAARVAALAGPSEILVSSTVKDLAAGSGIEFEDRGRHALKGVPDEWQLFRALARPTPPG